MPSNKRTIYLGLDYSQFSGGITEINRKMGLLDAEFKLATQQAKNYGMRQTFSESSRIILHRK